jgi:hypothetical protein
MPHPTHRQLFAVGLGHPGDSARPPGEDMHPLSSGAGARSAASGNVLTCDASNASNPGGGPERT